MIQLSPVVSIMVCTNVMMGLDHTVTTLSSLPLECFLEGYFGGEI